MGNKQIAVGSTQIFLAIRTKEFLLELRSVDVSSNFLFIRILGTHQIDLIPKCMYLSIKYEKQANCCWQFTNLASNMY